jgi:hypothetical protein
MTTLTDPEDVALRQIEAWLAPHEQPQVITMAGSCDDWRRTQAEARQLVRAGRDRKAVRLLERHGLDPYEAAREVADMRELRRRVAA